MTGKHLINRSFTIKINLWDIIKHSEFDPPTTNNLYYFDVYIKGLRVAKDVQIWADNMKQAIDKYKKHIIDNGKFQTMFRIGKSKRKI